MHRVYYFSLWLILAGLIAPGYAIAAVGSLTVKLLDHISEAGLVGQEVHAYEKGADGTLTWKAKRVTDAGGLTKFDLDGLGSGKVYEFQAQPYGYSVHSDAVSATGWYSFRVGKLQIQVIDGITEQPKAGQAVVLKRWQADGNHVGVMSAQTDAGGWLKLDPPSLGQVGYVLTAISPTDGQWKSSEPYWVKGPHRFVLGNAAVVGKLRDGVTGAQLGSQWMEVWEKLAGGGRTLKEKRWTDANGEIRFDLAGMKEGRRYILRAQPYLDAVESGEIGQGGEQELKAGKLQVTLIDGRNEQAYGWRDITLVERQADGTLKGIKSYRTDGAGKLRLDPSQLGTRDYLIRAASLADGSDKDSPAYGQGGSYSFKVGGAGLTVKLLDHISEAGLVGQEVHAYEKGADGTLTWKAKRVTDAGGLTKFDLDGLGSGKVYNFSAQPYGYWVKSEDISATGWYSFRVGTTLLTLMNTANASPLAGQTVAALEKLSNGSLRWERQAVSDARGQTRFDLPGLGKGGIYVFRAINPFADGKDYFSDLLNWRGAFTFSLDRTDTNAPDRIPPQVSVLFPKQASAVSKGGFRLYGTATDDVSVTAVRLLLTLPSGAAMERAATYQAEAGTWHVDTGSLGEAGAGALGVRVVAVDSGLNQAEAQLELTLLDDRTAPNLEVLSHADGASVPMGGFVVNGRVTDDTLSPSLTVQISGGGLANDEVRNVEVAPSSGNWAVRVAPESGFTSAPLTLTLTARDGMGNTAVKMLRLYPSDAFGQVWHVLQRTAYGAVPGQIKAVVGEGVQNYLLQQLAPDGLDDSDFTQRQQGWMDLGSYLATDYLRHAVFSRRQLREVMTWFWDNHFNTYYYKHSIADFEHREMAGFRAHAFGRFRDLLGVSAKSPAMLHSLDGVNNMKGRPNENYARELMELHTLGVTGGYSQQDVVDAARAFTGWSEVDGQFVFNANLHDNGLKVVLGSMLPANGGQSDGEAVLDLVARHPSTARFVCGKLVTLLVSDIPVDSLIQQCAVVFQNSVDAPDQMARVLLTILSSQQFLGTTYRSAKMKTPLELAVGLTRNLGGESGGDDLAEETQRMGMGLFVNSSPTGYAETGDAWVSTSMLLNRVRFLDRALNTTSTAGDTQFNLMGLMQADVLETAEGIVGRLLDLTLGPTWTRRHWDLGMSLLTEGGKRPYFSWAPDAEQRLRSLGKALAVLPEYQYQ